MVLVASEVGAPLTTGVTVPGDDGLGLPSRGIVDCDGLGKVLGRAVTKGLSELFFGDEGIAAGGT